MFKMKKYPYTESTDLIVCEQPKAKEKKSRPWLVALSSALAASVLTAGIFGTGMYFMNQNNTRQLSALKQQPAQTEQTQNDGSQDDASLTSFSSKLTALFTPKQKPAVFARFILRNVLPPKAR